MAHESGLLVFPSESQAQPSIPRGAGSLHTYDQVQVAGHALRPQSNYEVRRDRCAQTQSGKGTRKSPPYPLWIWYLDLVCVTSGHSGTA